MMRFIAPVLLLISFTDPNGLVVWFNPDHIVAVTPATNCDSAAASKIITTIAIFCVRENQVAAQKKIDAATK